MADSTIVHIATVSPVDAEALKDEKNNHRRRSLIREFSLNTSAHGFGGIARSESIANRIFWTISTILFIGVMLYFVIESIRAYFDYPTQTSVSIVVQWPRSFPAFTICNASPFRLDRFLIPYMEYLNSLNVTNTNDSSSVPLLDVYISKFLTTKLNRNESLDDYMFSLESMLIKCQYNGFNCSVGDFIPFMSPYYGLCYTFNGKVKNLPNGGVRDINENGGNGRLRLQLYVHSYESVENNMAGGIGMIGMIHDNTEFPLIDVAGIELATGRKHKLSFTKQTNYLLKSPYTSCTDTISLSMQAMFDRYQNADYAYSQLVCLTLCQQVFTYDECGCVHPLQWSARSIVKPDSSLIINAPICNITDICYTEAAIHFMSSESIYEKYCADCQQECQHTTFSVKTSSLAAPLAGIMDSIKAFVGNSSIRLPTDWQASWQTYILNNYVGIDVVQESILVENYTQEATLNGVDVLSNVGGQTGLWIGISFLSLMEIAEMLYRLIRYQLYFFLTTLKNKRRNNQQFTENV